MNTCVMESSLRPDPNKPVPSRMCSKDEMKKSANSLRKEKIHDQRVIAVLYCTFVLTVGISVTLYCTRHRPAELELSFVGFYSTIYLASVIAMVYILVYVYANRNASVEAVMTANLPAQRILFSLRGESISLYLRIGICIFAAMAITYSACRAYEVPVADKHFERVIPYTFSKMLFIIIQSTFLILLHRLVVLVQDRLFSFILLHLITVNISMWMESVIVEISNSMELNEQMGNETLVVNTKQAVQAAAYFLPGTAEYCAIAAVNIYEMLQRVGQFIQIEADHEHVKRGCRIQNLKTNVWLIFGTVLSMLTVVTILIMMNIENLIDSARAAVQLGEISLIHSVSLIFALLGILGIRNLKFSVSFAKNNLDGKLLLVTFFLAFNCSVASSIICIDHLVNATSSSMNTPYVIAKLASLLLEIIQAVVQTYFIQNMFHRCRPDKKYNQRKPGQPFIIVLSVLNFMLWMIYSFQVKEHDILFQKNGRHFKELNLQGLVIFTRVLLPMTMLFRYHSSVCLAICSVRIYEDEVTRYECVLRRIKKDRTTFVQNHMYGPLNMWGLVDGVRQQTRQSSFKTQSHPKPVSDVCQLAIRKCRSAENIRSSHNMDCLQVTQVDSRRDSIANLEMARIHVIATEVNYRMLGFKMTQSWKEQRPISKEMSGMSNQISGKSNHNISSDKEVQELRVNPQLGFLKSLSHTRH